MADLKRWLAIVTGLPPAFALMLSGVAKLEDPFMSARFLSRLLSIPLAQSFPLARALGGFEATVALLLCLFWGRTRVLPWAMACLFALFAGVTASVASSDPQAASCGCFGSLMGELGARSLWRQVILDVALMGLAVAHSVSLPNRARGR